MSYLSVNAATLFINVVLSFLDELETIIYFSINSFGGKNIFVSNYHQNPTNGIAVFSLVFRRKQMRMKMYK